MKKILIPVDPGQPQRLRSALAQAVRIHRQEQAIVHLLSVQPRLNGHVAMFFGPHELSQLLQSAGREALAPAQAQLEAAGVAFTWSVRTGRSAETIAAAATELGSDVVLFGEAQDAGLAGRLFGSLASQVRHLLGAGKGCEVIGA